MDPEVRANCLRVIRQYCEGAINEDECLNKILWLLIEAQYIQEVKPT